MVKCYYSNSVTIVIIILQTIHKTDLQIMLYIVI